MRFLGPLCAVMLIACLPLIAESKDPKDYPLRLHVFVANGTSFYHYRVLDEVKGDGRANLFENGEPRAVDFSFTCSDRIKPSLAYETYPARWKKPGQELIVMFPVMGKANTYFTCNLKTNVKDYAYFPRNGGLQTESPADFKKWMVRHDYDPEHDKNTPKNLEPRAGSGAAAQ